MKHTVIKNVQVTLTRAEVALIREVLGAAKSAMGDPTDRLYAEFDQVLYDLDR